MENGKRRVVFKPSNVHEGHYVYIDEKSTDIVVNLYAYQTIKEYRIRVDETINKLLTCKSE